MKSIRKVLMTFTILSIVIFANQPTNMGFNIGINGSNHTGPNISESNIKFGFCGGLYLSHKISQGLYFHPEVNFTMKGDKTEYFGHDVTTTLNYIDIPILLGIPITNELKLMPGIYGGFGIGGKVESDDNEESIDSEMFQNPEFGLTLGFQLKYPIDNPVKIGLRYSHGLTNVESDGGTYKNSVIQLILSL